MSSYFDQKTTEVSEVSDQFSRPNFIRAVAEIEQDVAMSLIAEWHVGTHAGLPPRDEAIQYLAVARCSELIDRMHSLFHEVATRRIRTRFGMLSDHPRAILDQRDWYDNGAA